MFDTMDELNEFLQQDSNSEELHIDEIYEIFMHQEIYLQE